VRPEVAERALTSSPVGAAVQVETEWGQAGAEVEARAAEASGSGVVEGPGAEPAAGASVAAEVGPEAKAGGEAVGEEAAAVVAAAGAAAGSPRPP